MYICKECGHIFEQGEEKRYTESHGEVFACCPVCGGGYEEAVICEACGGAFDPDDERMIGKWCKDCLLGMVDYEMFKKYLHWSADAGSSDEMSEIEWFFFRDLWGISEHLVRGLRSSFDCKSDLFSLYDAYVEGDKLDTQFTGKHPFLDKIKNFIADDIGCFADWLEEAEKNGSV